MTATQQTELTVADKRAMRTGKCAAVVCRDECGAYAYSFKMDGYDHCVCGHTQWAHSVGTRQ